MENKKIKVKYLENIEEGKKYHYWYGGDTAKIEYGEDIEIYIAANGDVVGDIYNKDGESVGHFKDKRNGGAFYTIGSGYFKNDEELMRGIFSYTPDKKELEELGLEYYVHFDYSNSWEIIPCYKGHIDEDCCFYADGYSIEDAIAEVMNNIDSIIKSI